MSMERDTDEENYSVNTIETAKYYCNTCGAELLIGQACPYCSGNAVPLEAGKPGSTVGDNINK